MSGRSATDTGPSRDDLRHVAEARDLAVAIPVRPWPNPPVGAVVVRDGVVVGRGAHHGAGTAHAERVALDAAGSAARGATLYCTLEPCHHHGRTPPCSGAIVDAGIARVVFGVRDPNPLAGGGADHLRGVGVEVLGGVLAAECLDLIWPFVCTDQFARPYVELKTATSLDGRFGRATDPPGQPGYLTGAAARRDVHARRRWVDLVLVGSGTARRDRPRLDARLADSPLDGPTAPPLAGVVARDGAAAAALDRDRWLVFHAAGRSGALAAGAEGVACAGGPDGQLDLHDLLSAGTARGVHALMVEGGPRLAASFLAAGLVDRWVQYVAPTVVGDGPAWPAWTAASPVDFTLSSVARLGRDLRLVWDRREVAAELRRLGTPEVA
ncbi:MAG: bifunctional diaminohydroxyphosphoribosylaminopyrimidine deaminase/5-amino-6-(5-phosphoribosylamino)uracil reductase RibD [Candidatus Krumholzibacteriia bacterium]